MSWGKFLLAAMLCVGGAKATMITSGTVTVSQNGPSGSANTGGSLVLSDGVTVNNSHTSDGPLTNLCYDSGQGCSFTGFPVILLGDTFGFSDLIGAFLNVTFDTGFTAVRGVAVQTFQTPFTLTGSVYKDLYPNPSCPFPDPTTPGSCSVSVTGSGIATSTITEYPTQIPGTLDAFYLSSTRYTFSSVPEPSTPIFIATGIGVLVLMRKRFSGCRS